MSWLWHQLAEISNSVEYGLTASSDPAIGTPKFLRITDIQEGAVNWDTVPGCTCPVGDLARYSLQDGDIVFARTGATTGKSFLINDPPRLSVFASYLIRVRPDPKKVDAGYLAHFFDTADYWQQITKGSTGTTQPGVNGTKLKELRVPLPPLPEQKRIAAILDKADAIRRKRQEAIRLTEELLRSAFLDMFGDPVTNPKGWPETTIAEICRQHGGSVQTGPFGSQLHAADYSPDGIPVVMPQDLIAGGISEKRIARVPQEHVRRLERHQLEFGDVVFSRRGDVARFAVVEDEEVGWLCGTGCLRIRFANAALAAGFLRGELAHSSKRNWLESEAKGTTMLNLNTSILGRMPIRVPPVELQQDYAKTVDLVRSVSSNAAEHFAALEVLQAALTQRAFSGTL